jgi:hypothetical protein
MRLGQSPKSSLRDQWYLSFNKLFQNGKVDNTNSVWPITKDELIPLAEALIQALENPLITSSSESSVYP